MLLNVYTSLIFLNLLLGCHFDCPPGSVSGTTLDRCYKFIGSPASFLEAQSICLSRNGNLTSIESSYENSFLASNAAELFPNTPDIWIGGSHILVPGNWTWNDNTPFSYINWMKGQPSTISGNDCITIDLPAGTWKAQTCSITLPFICEVPSTSDQNNGQTKTPCVSSSVPPKHTYTCPSGWNYFNYTEQCYYIGDAANWQTARLYCMQIGGQLASIHNAAEDGFVLDIGHNVGDIWIGFNRLEGSWAWIDHTLVDYTDWGYLEPSGDGSCAHVWRRNMQDKDRLHWNDEDCGRIKNFACKTNPTITFVK